jgi:hypothetical protein
MCSADRGEHQRVSARTDHTAEDDSIKQPVPGQHLVGVVDIAFLVFCQQHKLIVVKCGLVPIAESNSIRMLAIHGRFGHDSHGTGGMRNATVGTLNWLPGNNLSAHGERLKAEG